MDTLYSSTTHTHKHTRMPNSGINKTPKLAVTKVNKTTLRFGNPLFHAKKIVATTAAMTKSPSTTRKPQTMKRNFGCPPSKKPVSVLYRGPLQKKEVVSPTKLNTTTRPVIDGTQENVIATWSLKKKKAQIPQSDMAYMNSVLAKWRGKKTGQLFSNNSCISV